MVPRNDESRGLGRTSLRGRTAMVTGASRGIGRAIAEALAWAGADVIVTARTSEACAETLHSIRALGSQAWAYGLRLEDQDQIGRVTHAARDELQNLEILVNNAGILRPHRLDRLTSAEFDEIHAVNVRGPVFLARALRAHLGARRRGSIINIGALAAIRPMEGLGAYASSKSAMHAWTKVMAREWAAEGIRVNELVPGPIATEMILPRTAAARKEFEHDMARQTLLGRVGTPDDLVGAALFLASDSSAFMTGQTIVVDGGMLT
jgi:NAD(P)-dependent dehydrogenase (short-subunit alcohol dehydrogenase family)